MNNDPATVLAAAEATYKRAINAVLEQLTKKTETQTLEPEEREAFVHLTERLHVLDGADEKIDPKELRQHIQTLTLGVLSRSTTLLHIAEKRVTSNDEEGVTLLDAVNLLREASRKGAALLFPDTREPPRLRRVV